MPSFDGSPLDVDVTLPASNTGDRHPLIVMLHGFANNKHEWESRTDEGNNGDKWHWNNHWFAEHGFYVLTYTARGFPDPGRSDPSYQPDTPGGSSYTGPGTNGTIHLKSRDFEIRDTQWLAALTAAAYSDLDRDRVAVTGGSYGGGESWTQASQPLWDVNGFPTLTPHAPLPVLQLQVAVPKYPWTDLGYSLAPNGHKGPFQRSIYTSSTGWPTSDTGQGNPLGVIKYSYATGFFIEGMGTGFLETVPENVPGWFADAVGVGDPYDAGAPATDRPVYIPELRRGLTELRSSFYQDEYWAKQVGKREVAIYSVSGWTDDLFPPVESFRQFKYLKSLDPLWPVELAVADIGHPRAQNPEWEWQRINGQAWDFLRQQIRGSHRQQTQVMSLPTVCPGSSASTDEDGDSDDQGDEDGGDAAGAKSRSDNGGGGGGNDETDQGSGGGALVAPTPEGLARGTLSIDYKTPGSIFNRKPPPFPAPDPADLDNMQTDPAFGSALLKLPNCRQSIMPTTAPEARYTAYSRPLSDSRTYVGLGYIRLNYTLAGATTATLDARVWDVAPDHKALLVARGTYRIDGNLTGTGYDRLPTGHLDLPLFGNHWTLAAGHQVRLDLTQVDYPTFLPGNTSSTVISFPSARLVLPTRDGSGSDSTTPGSD
ncbi:MAG: hypothetical protein M3077_01995 [Candidatus Dormibacteraeota bacterium]|nr:hypothetical protein [Candidatus Dormibacteraeota bacterium]